MTKVHSTLDKMIVQMSKIERHYTVGYLPSRSDDSIPAINLKGKWLNQAEFTTGTPLIIRVMQGCLVITTEPKHQTDNRKLLEEIQQTQQRICDITVKLNQ